MDPNGWMEIATLIIAAYGLIPRDKSQRTKDQEETLTAISHAYHNTEQYYADRAKGLKQNTTRELELAKDWEKAGIKVRKYDHDLGYRLGLKSRYWRDGGTWSDEQIKNAGIGLQRVRTEGMSIFLDAKKVKRKG